MLKLIKYEFMKNRLGLAIMTAIFVLLEGVFLYGYIANDEEKLGIGIAFLTLYTIVAFFYVMFIGISNYEKDLTRKSGYLVYLTPNSPFKIICSKFLYVFFVGVAVCVVMGGVGIMDFFMLVEWSAEIKNVKAVVEIVAENIGFDIYGMLFTWLLEIINFVINFFSILAITYFAVTLTATALNNSRIRGFVSTVLTLALIFAFSWISGKLIPEYVPEFYTLSESIKYLLPSIIYNTIVVLIGMFGSAYLTKKAISL